MAKNTTILPVKIGDREILLEVQVSPETGKTDSGDREKVALTTYDIEPIKEDIKEIAKSFLETLKNLKPTKINIEIGVEVGLETGKLTSMILKGSGKSNLKINLEWNLNDVNDRVI
jgi:tetrahydromethanopterin S-methyltransferase subunit B